MGSQLLAIQDGSVKWVHAEPITKSQRLTDSAGQVIAGVELDPYGGETTRSFNQAVQPRKYTSYERDSNGGDEAMFRRYEGRQQRFAQPDPYSGSYDLTDPQSFNRYAYVENDPVNFIDPTGLHVYWRENEGNPVALSMGAGGGWSGGGGLYGVLTYSWIDDRITHSASFLIFIGGFGAGRVGGGRGVPPQNSASPQSTREERCLRAIEDAARLQDEISKTIAKSLAYPGGFDQGHVDKVINKKAGLDDALRRIEQNCNNYEKKKFSTEIEGFRETLNAPNPKVGERLPLQEMKIAGAVGNILSTISLGARAAWAWIFGQ